MENLINERELVVKKIERYTEKSKNEKIRFILHILATSIVLTATFSVRDLPFDTFAQGLIGFALATYGLAKSTSNLVMNGYYSNEIEDLREQYNIPKEPKTFIFTNSNLIFTRIKSFNFFYFIFIILNHINTIFLKIINLT
mgnify:CR=1 FL=1